MKHRWIVAHICGFRYFEKYSALYMVLAETEIEAKKEAFKIHYGYNDDSKFRSSDRLEFRATNIDEMQVGELF